MYLRSLRIQNYKSFEDSGELSFGRGFNVVVGQNNVGKTALLEALNFARTQSVPHRTASSPRGLALKPNSVFDADVEISGGEAREEALTLGDNYAVWVPAPVGAAAQAAMAAEFFSRDAIVSSIRVVDRGASPRRWPSFPVPHSSPSSQYAMLFTVNRQGQELKFGGAAPNNSNDTVVVLAGRLAASKTYAFRAERLNIGSTPATEAAVLNPDGSNLPAVLFHLASNPARFRRYNQHVREIFPSISEVVVAPQQSNFEVRVWSVDTSTERDDLAIRLTESGTGIGQVLAILYVAMTMPQALIIIDEPNSFLHPGASKKLIQILKRYDHQYVISTHSPELIVAADPSVIHLVRREAGKSVVEQVDRKSIEGTRAILDEIGVSMSDVFGADRIVWVEGATEQLTFPKLLQASGIEGSLGTTFVSVKNTGDFESKKSDPRWVMGIYERLTNGAALLPATVAFGFDREGKDAAAVRDLERRTLGKVHVLPRRSIENYLVHPAAIAAVVTQYSAVEVSGADVSGWLGKHQATFGYNGTGDLVTFEGAKLLASAFGALTAARLEFSKTTHSVALIDWILRNDAAHLAELTDYVRGLAAAA